MNILEQLLKKRWKFSRNIPFVLKLMGISYIFLLISYGEIFAQETRTISGTVLSKNDNSPIPGANINIKGTTSGSITDVDGNFSIEASPEDILQISFCGEAV